VTREVLPESPVLCREPSGDFLGWGRGVRRMNGPLSSAAQERVLMSCLEWRSEGKKGERRSARTWLDQHLLVQSPLYRTSVNRKRLRQQRVIYEKGADWETRVRNRSWLHPERALPPPPRMYIERTTTTEEEIEGTQVRPGENLGKEGEDDLKEKNPSGQGTGQSTTSVTALFSFFLFGRGTTLGSPNVGKTFLVVSNGGGGPSNPC